MAVNEGETMDDITKHASNVSDENLELSMEDQINRLALSEEKAWKNLDSVHSHKSDLSALASHPGGPNNNGSFNNSFDFNDSCASFASFGGSEEGGSRSSLNDSIGELAEAKAGFCNLDKPEPRPPPPRRNGPLNAVPDSRLVRTASMRMVTLQGIGEEEEEPSVNDGV